MDEELSKNYFEATLLHASEHSAKKGAFDVHPTGCSLTADKSRAQPLQNHAWKPTEVHPANLHHRLFFNYDLLNPIPDEHAESSPWWQVKKP